MIKLSIWEQILIGAAVSYLSVLASQTKNATAAAGIKAALEFLNTLLAGQVPTE